MTISPAALQATLDIRDCERLVKDYTIALADGYASRAADLFSEAAVWHSARVRLEGRESIRSYLSVREQNTVRVSRHLVTNHLVDIVDQDHATGRAFFVEYRSDVASSEFREDVDPALIGDYFDRYQRIDGKWYIAERRLQIAFVRRGTVLRSG